ncbi:tRNA (adenosine(37)-N6)-threonylcarbamoyltransferase complex ATPase subunit type 1 TsaE [Enterovirga sp. GCM10030262]|uniref:tRNA (adenosine(37)-N6)-threonylcarbamoyltransferase complex ATPase subunit type 1 TsaE n=1 Tax=Enterovirga sp. GCM10030262 TaxID=3273391 RepID=UPI003620C6DA
MITLPDPASTEMLGVRLGGQIRRGDAVALFGDLGAGKTTLSRGILHGLGFSGEVASPTFPIVLAYDPPDVRLPLWHVDLYRIEDPQELEELALDEAKRDGALVLEWPERLGSALWPDALRLHLSIAGEGVRALTATVPPAWEGRWPPP